MTLNDAIALLSTIFTGLLAGAEFAIHYGIRGSDTTLDEYAQLKLRQAMVRRLRFLIPALFLPAAGFGIAATMLAYPTAFWQRCAGLFALAVWVAIRVVGTVPINSATLDWSPDAPPNDWKARIARAERFHIVGVWAAVIAFIAFAAAPVSH